MHTDRFIGMNSTAHNMTNAVQCGDAYYTDTNSCFEFRLSVNASMHWIVHRRDSIRCAVLLVYGNASISVEKKNPKSNITNNITLVMLKKLRSIYTKTTENSELFITKKLRGKSYRYNFL